MSLYLLQKEIKQLKDQIVKLQIENQELKQRLFYAEYLTSSPEIKHEMDNLKKENSCLRIALIAMKKENEAFQKTD